MVDLRGYAWRYRALGMAFPGDSPEALGEELKTVLSYAGRFGAQGALAGLMGCLVTAGPGACCEAAAPCLAMHACKHWQTTWASRSAATSVCLLKHAPLPAVPGHRVRSWDRSISSAISWAPCRAWCCIVSAYQIALLPVSLSPACPLCRQQASAAPRAPA